MAVKVGHFRPKNFSNIGALSLHSTYICTEMTSSTKKHTKNVFFLFFWWRHHKKDRFLMTSLQKHPFLNDVIIKHLFKWWRHNDKLQPLISQLPWPFKKWKFGDYLLTSYIFKIRSHFTFSEIKGNLWHVMVLGNTEQGVKI